MFSSKTECSLCGSIAEIQSYVYPGYQDPFTFQIFHCNECNTSFSLPRMQDTKEIYDIIYKNGPHVPGYDRYWIYSTAIKKVPKPLNYLAKVENTYWAILESLNQIVTDKQTTKILEVGSGLGYLTYALNTAGYNCCGIDISDIAVKNAVHNYGEYFVCSDVSKFAETNLETYDIIILAEVIEHINEPAEFLKSVNTLTKKNGYIILTTPNKSIYDSDIIWATDNPPIHCWWFSEKSIEYLGWIIDSKVTFIDFTDFYRRRSIILTKNPVPNLPTLDALGEISCSIVQNLESNSIYSKIKGFFFKKLPIFEKIYMVLKNKFRPNYIFLKQKGTIICALLQKK